MFISEEEDDFLEHLILNTFWEDNIIQEVTDK